MNLELNSLDVFYVVGAVMLVGVAVIYWLDAVSSISRKSKTHARI